MTALDTNIIIRFLVRDDQKQAGVVLNRLQQAERDKELFVIPILVFLESIWVLESSYDMSRQGILDSFACLRQMPIMEFENDIVVERFLVEGKKSNTALSDLLIGISARLFGCDSVLTFDKKATKSAFFEFI